MLADESVAGHVHLAGIAIAHATNMSEGTARNLVRRVVHLREEVKLKDPEILICLNDPRGRVTFL
jgi:hypothetical protein